MLNNHKDQNHEEVGNVSYPRALSRVSLGTDEPEEVVRRLTVFAKTYNDTTFLIEHISPTVDALWALSRYDKLTSRALSHHLGELAFESFGASVNWYCEHGFIPSEASILWIAELACNPDRYTSAFGASVAGLADLVIIRGNSRPEELALLRDMNVFLLRDAEADIFAYILWLTACLNAADCSDGCIQNIIETRLNEQAVWEEVANYWNAKKNRLSDMAKHLAQNRHLHCGQVVDLACRSRAHLARELFTKIVGCGWE